MRTTKVLGKYIVPGGFLGLSMGLLGCWAVGDVKLGYSFFFLFCEVGYYILSSRNSQRRKRENVCSIDIHGRFLDSKIDVKTVICMPFSDLETLEC